MPHHSRSSSQPRPSVRQESLKYESESSRIPVRLSLRCITGLWARYSSHPILSIIISLLFSLPGHSVAPTTALKEGNKLGVMRGTGMIAPLSWTRFLEDEEPECEYPLDVELIDANPIFDFHAHEGTTCLSACRRARSHHARSQTYGGPPSAILAAPTVKNSLVVATIFGQKAWRKADSET